MKIAIIGRTEILYDSALVMLQAGFKIACILTGKEAPEYERTAADFKELAQEKQIPFAQGSKVMNYFDFLRASQADVAVSINYPSIIPQSVIDLFPLGILNAHGGDLPRYRGNACQAWAILNGEENIGLCIHKMTGGELDSGDIIMRDYLSIDHNTKVTEAWEWMRMRVPVLMLEAVEQLRNDSNYVLETQSKNPLNALRCYPRRPEDGRIQWTQSAIEILRLINASNKPYAGAFCDFEGQLMRIWDAALVDDNETYCAVPGQVIAITDNHIVVACGSGKLMIKSIQFEYEEECCPSSRITSIRKRLR